MAESKYTLMEEAQLMCLRSDGEVSSGPIGKKCPSLGSAAGIMMELMLRQLLEVVVEGKETRFRLKSDTTGNTGDDILDQAIHIILAENPELTPSGRSIDDWIKSLNGTLITRKGIPDLEKRVFHRLVAKKVLKQEEEKLLGLISEKYPFGDLVEIDRIQQHWKDVLGTSPANISSLSERDFCLMGLFYALDKPFVHRPGNAIDINRIYPESDTRKAMRVNVEAVINSESNDQLSIGTAVHQSLVRRIIRVTVMGLFGIFTQL